MAAEVEEMETIRATARSEEETTTVTTSKEAIKSARYLTRTSRAHSMGLVARIP